MYWSWLNIKLIFKEYKFVLTILLLHLFISFIRGVFPGKRKVIYILAIFKGGEISELIVCHPISTISIIPILFESIFFFKKINLMFKSIIINEKYIFITKRSIATNLLVFQNCVLDSFNAGHQVDVIYTDFSFD